MATMGGYGTAVDWWALGILMYECLTEFTPRLEALKIRNCTLKISNCTLKISNECLTEFTPFGGNSLAIGNQ